jgi:hypothetical protein
LTIPSSEYIAEKLALLGPEGIASELRRHTEIAARVRLRDLQQRVLDNVPAEAREMVAHAFDLARASGQVG